MQTDPSLRLIKHLESLIVDLRTVREGGSMTAADLEDAPVLQHWTRVSRPVAALRGDVIGHPLLGTGTDIVTSEVYLLDPVDRWARTLSRRYRLGPPARPW
jgi:hypothetical protein